MTDYSRGYRAGLEAAAGVAKAEAMKYVRQDATLASIALEIEDRILALPVPGEAPAPVVRTVPMMPTDPEADARMEELRAKQPPETTRKIAAPPAEPPDLRGARTLLVEIRHELLRVDGGAPESVAELPASLQRASTVKRTSDAIHAIDAALAAQPASGPAAYCASCGTGMHADEIHCESCWDDLSEDEQSQNGTAAAQPEGQAAPIASRIPADLMQRILAALESVNGGMDMSCTSLAAELRAAAAAPGGEDAEALLRECEKALLAVRDSKYLAKAWRSVPVIRALVDRAVARLAARAWGR